MPWWAVIILTLAGLFYFDNLYEVIAIGLIFDSIYGTEDLLFLDIDFQYTVTLIALVIFVIVHRLKKNLVMY